VGANLGFLPNGKSVRAYSPNGKSVRAPLLAARPSPDVEYDGASIAPVDPRGSSPAQCLQLVGGVYRSLGISAATNEPSELKTHYTQVIPVGTLCVGDLTSTLNGRSLVGPYVGRAIPNAAGVFVALDPAVIAALIGFAGTIVASGLTVSTSRRRKEEQTRKREAELALKKVAEPDGVLAIESAYTLECYEVRMEFDEEGSGKNERLWRGIVSTRTIENLTFPYAFQVDSPNGRVGVPVVRELDNSDLVPTLVDNVETEKLISGTVLLPGLFVKHDTKAEFSITVPFERAICTTRQRAQAAYAGDAWKQEYLTARVKAPAKVLRIVISMPPSHRALRPEPSAVVFVGDEELVNQAETERVRPLLTFADGRATLVVDKPLIGMNYAISWMPPIGKQM